MVDWNTILGNRHAVNVITDFATENLCAKLTSAKLQSPEAKREFNNAVRHHKSGYTRTLARKALRRRGVKI